MIRRELLSMKKIILTAAVCLGGYVPLQGQVSLTIEKAMDIAEEHSPSLRRSHMNLERYQQNLVAQRASLKSKFSLNLNPVDYSKSRSFDNRLSQWYTNERFSATGTFQVDQPILWTDGVLSLINRFGWQDNNSNIDGTKTSNKAFSNDLYLQLSQPIFTYNKRKMELQQIEYDYENANISYALQRLSTEKDITQQFYSVYMAQSQLAITREELTNAQQSYEIIKNKVEADLAARDELFQAEVNLASARSSLEEQQVSLENSKDQLKQTLGMDLNEDIMVFAEVQIKPVEVNLEKAIQHGLESRLELRQREIESKELAFDMIKTKALNEFKGDIALSFGLIGDNRHLEKIYNNPTQNPRVAISFSVPIFDWGEKKARVKAQEVAQKINRLEFHEDKVNIELNIRQTWRNLENLLSQIKIAKQNVANAQRTYDLNLTRYREGDITGMDMNQFQTQLSNKKIAYTQALINYKIELLNLKILSLYLQLSQPIFTYNKRKMELQQIEYDYENANISYALQRLSTEKDITQQFYSVYMAQSQLAITREELTNAQQSYEIIKNKVEADLAARDELFQAEVNLASARSSLEEQQVSLENSKDQLKQTLGMDLNEDIMVFAEVQIKPVEVNLEKAIQHGLESRLELRQREIESKELAFDMIKTKALNEFKGDIALSFGLIGDNRHLEKIYNNPTQNPRVAISFSVPIFDWGEKKARVKAQEVAQKINRLEFHEDKVNIELNIRQTWRNLENLLSQIKIAKQNVANAQRTYDLNLTRYREGDITGMDMNQFQTQLSNKKIAYTQALINYKIELLNLKILSLYDFEHDVPIVPMEDLVTKK